MKKTIVSALALAFAPALAFAQTPNLSYATNLMTSVKSLVSMALPLVLGLALLGFFWGLVKFIWGADKDKESAKNTMMWGIVVLFVMVAVWGLVGFLYNITGVGTQTSQTAPTVTGI